MKVHVVNLGKSFALKEFQKKVPLKLSLKEPLVVHVGNQKHFVALRYGVMVFWNMTKIEEKKWINLIRPFLSDPLQPLLEDVSTITLSTQHEGIFRGKIYLKTFDPHKIGLTSVVLGRSLALEQFEIEAEKALSEFDAIMKSFGQKGESHLSTKILLKKVGFAMNVQHLIVSSLAFLDKPDLTWENAELDKLYNELSLDYELDDRYDVLNEKLKLLFHNIQFILDFIDARKSFWLELTIVLLIIIEILLFVYELIKV